MVVEKATDNIAYAVVTGGAGGLGKQLAKHLLIKGYHVILGVRKSVTGEMLVREIQYETKLRNLEWGELDLEDLSSVASFVEKLKIRKLPIRLLINNAGVLAPPPGSKTFDNLDTAFSVNYVAPFFLTHLMLPQLIRYGGTIVNVTCNSYQKPKVMDTQYFRDQVEGADTQGLLRVTIISGRNVTHANSSNKFASPVVTFRVLGHEFRTKVKKDTKSPVWNETFSVKTVDPPDIIELTVYDRKVSAGNVIGTCKVFLSGLVSVVGSLDSTMLVEANIDDGDSKAKNVAEEHHKLIRELVESVKSTGGTERSGRFAGIMPKDDERTPAAMRSHFVSWSSQAQGLAIVDESGLTLSFTVRKRLNMLKTSVRVIKIDFSRRQVRNETIHGRVRKTFPFLQILGTESVTDNPSQLRVKFLKFSCESLDGKVQVAGGQRDYLLTFESKAQADFYSSVLMPYTWSTPLLDGMRVHFYVYKRFSAINSAMRILVVDLMKKQLLNKVPTDISVASAVEDEELKRTFDFTQITQVEEVSPKTKPLLVAIHFRGGHDKYQIEFLSARQMQIFLDIINPFLVRSVEGSVVVKIMYTRPPSVRSNKYVHKITRTVMMPSLDGVNRPWMASDIVEIPMKPEWQEPNWDSARGMMRKQLSSLQAAQLSRMYFVSFSMELARRLEEKKCGVTCHLFDPGYMDTRYARKASGLGHFKTLAVWRLKRMGRDPEMPAKGLVACLNTNTLADFNGIYIQYQSLTGKIALVNLTSDRKAKRVDPPHPVAATMSHMQTKLLWDSTCEMLNYDFERQTWSAFQILMTS